MSTFVKRGTENRSLVASINKVPQRLASMPAGKEKETLEPIVIPLHQAVNFAIAVGLAGDQAVAEWLAASNDLDLRNDEADRSVRLANARLVEWAGMRPNNRLVHAIVPNGTRLFTEDDDDGQPEAMTLLVRKIKASTEPGLTAERKAELVRIIEPTIEPLARARDRMRLARIGRRLADADFENAADAAWVAARKACSRARLEVPESVVEDVFAPLLVAGAPAPAEPGSAPPAV